MAARRTPIRFGTSGWRGVLGGDFTFAGAWAVSRALADWALERMPGAAILIAYDTRFLGERLATGAARVVTAAGARAILTDRPVPTPVAVQGVRRRRAAAGLVFTASHNPPEYQGIKVVAALGAPAGPELTREIERRVPAAWGTEPPSGQSCPPRVDLLPAYRRGVLSRIRRPESKRGRLRVVYDALHGVGAGILDPLLEDLGVEVDVLHGDPDPRFGGAAPEPNALRLRELARTVRGRRGDSIGFATDGDADRFAVVDEAGRLLSETDALALLVDHMARTGRIRRGVALSVATGSLVERVARSHGLGVVRRPIGFKHLARALMRGEADVAGEESGGFAWAPLTWDKDGVLASCLLAERLASRGASLREDLRGLRARHGSSACGRTGMDLGAHVDRDAWMGRLRRRIPGQIDGARVVLVSEIDGLQLLLQDGFLMWRVSGTEPLLRIYAEAPSEASVARRLAAGVRWARRAAGSGFR